MSVRLRSGLCTFAAVSLLAALPAGAAPKKAGGHPDVAGEGECAACHRTATPEAFAAWERSRHGLALVKCVVCHGSTGADFRAKPAATRCGGCHAAQAASAGKRGPNDCFACHAPHALTANPHL